MLGTVAIHGWWQSRNGLLIRPIQYLRGIAALSVVWLHALEMMNFHALGPSRFGGSGVDLFFVISGFIIVITATTKRLSIKQFLLLRIIRIAPLYWLSTLLIVAAAHLGAFKTLQYSLARIIKSLFFVPYDGGPVLVAGWTLNYEMAFYFVFAFSLLFSRRWQFHLLTGMLLLLVALGLVFHFHGTMARTYTSVLLLEFLGGAAVGHMWMQNKVEFGLPLAILFLTVGWFLLFRWNQPPLLGFTQMAGALLVILGCLQRRVRMVESTILLVIGNWSYSIYLTHLFVLAALRILWRSKVDSLVLALSFMTIALVAAILVGGVCYKLVEDPLTRWLNKIAGVNRASSSSAKTEQSATKRPVISGDRTIQNISPLPSVKERV